MGTDSIEAALAIFRRHGGVLRTSEAIRQGIHPRTLYALRDSGVIQSLSRGLYRLADLPPLSNPDLVIVARKFPQAVICLVSALAFHELTTQVPHAVDVVLPSRVEHPALDYPPIRTFWFSGRAWSEGIQTYRVDDTAVRIYIPEKSVADSWKYRHKLGLDVALEALKLYRQRRDFDVTKLAEYARRAACRVEKVMQPYLEALQNILVHEPKPRNPRLYDAAKRIGLVEKTGRGVDRIFLDQLRLGRPAPSYERSDASGVRVVLRGGKANLAFAQFVYEQDKAGKALRQDELLILNQLEIERRIDTATAAALIQKPEGDARTALESLAERGLIQAKGEKRGRVYHLSASTYKALGFAEAYVRTRGFEPLQQEQMVLQYVDAHGSIARSQAADLCQLSEGQASRLLTRMRQKGPLRMEGRPPKGAFYIRARR